MPVAARRSHRALRSTLRAHRIRDPGRTRGNLHNMAHRIHQLRELPCRLDPAAAGHRHSKRVLRLRIADILGGCPRRILCVVVVEAADWSPFAVRRLPGVCQVMLPRVGGRHTAGHFRVRSGRIWITGRALCYRHHVINRRHSLNVGGTGLQAQRACHSHRDRVRQLIIGQIRRGRPHWILRATVIEATRRIPLTILRLPRIGQRVPHGVHRSHTALHIPFGSNRVRIPLRARRYLQSVHDRVDHFRVRPAGLQTLSARHRHADGVLDRVGALIQRCRPRRLPRRRVVERADRVCVGVRRRPRVCQVMFPRVNCRNRALHVAFRQHRIRRP